MPALHGIGVLVTRPEQQAMPLCRLLEIQGASTLRLPAIEIKALGNRREMAAAAGRSRGFRCHHFHQRQRRAVRRLAARSEARSDPGRHGTRDRSSAESSRLSGGRAAAANVRFREPAPAPGAGTSGGPPHTDHQGQRRAALPRAGTRAARRASDDGRCVSSACRRLRVARRSRRCSSASPQGRCR